MGASSAIASKPGRSEVNHPAVIGPTCGATIFGLRSLERWPSRWRRDAGPRDRNRAVVVRQEKGGQQESISNEPRHRESTKSYLRPIRAIPDDTTVFFQSSRRLPYLQHKMAVVFLKD